MTDETAESPEESTTDFAAEAEEDLAVDAPSGDRNIRLRAFGFLAGAFGGFLIALGALTPWGTGTIVSGYRTVVGVKVTPEGIIVLAAGVLIVLGLFALRFLATYEARRRMAIVAMLLGIVAAGVMASALLRPGARILGHQVMADALTTLPGNTEGAPAYLIKLDRDERYAPGIGIWLIFAGAGFTLLGGGLSMRWARLRGEQAVERGVSFGAPKSAQMPEPAAEPQPGTEPDPAS